MLFAHRLALALGNIDVDAMLDGISSDQLIRWIAYAKIEPFGEERGDLRSAIVASTIANANRIKGRVFKIDDFMPEFNKSKKTWQEMKSLLKQYAVQHNKVINRNG